MQHQFSKKSPKLNNDYRLKTKLCKNTQITENSIEAEKVQTFRNECQNPLITWNKEELANAALEKKRRRIKSRSTNLKLGFFKVENLRKTCPLSSLFCIRDYLRVV
ncbi:predicted protein [Arabidopsis lyrata subsp. lyrata]|uniref:Predicted protein n=1 Tax=Arabidopsis lyrata subsp. lyrata TaxID=81972 RepID=D7KB80_ARALL|nr:predicted protein [Arabidopsis lyrata subsp. lyrata]